MTVVVHNTFSSNKNHLSFASSPKLYSGAFRTRSSIRLLRCGAAVFPSDHFPAVAREVKETLICLLLKAQ